MWRFNRPNTGRNPHVEGAVSFDGTWDYTAATDRSLYSPIVADGVAYFGAFDSRMHAVNVEDGEQRWTAPAGDIIQSTPTYLDGIIYSAAYDGEIYAWDADTGQEIWNVVGGGVGERTTSVSVARDGGTILVGSDDAVYSLEPETGAINWEYPTVDYLTASPSIASGVAYLGDWSGYLYAIDVETGETVWTRRLGADVRSTAAIVDDVLYVGVFGSDGSATAADALGGGADQVSDHRADSGSTVGTASGHALPTGVYALEADTGEIVWRYEMDTVFSSPAVAEGLVFAGDYAGQFAALDRETGDPVWTYQFDVGPNEGVPASPAYADGVVYTGTSETESALYAFDAGTGDVLDRRDLGGKRTYSPVVVEDGVYVTHEDDARAADESGNAVLTAFQTDTSDRGVGGTVTGPDGEPIPGTVAYLVPRHQEWAAITVIGAYPDLFPPNPQEILDPEAVNSTDGAGAYALTGVDTGAYHLLALPPTDSGYDPKLVENVVVQDGTTPLDVTLSAGRPLSELDSTMDALFEESETRLADVTGEAAEVFVDGVDRIAGPASPEEYLMDAFGLADVALEYDLDAPPEEFREEVQKVVLDSSLDVAEHGIGLALEHVWGGLDPELQSELSAATSELLEAEWFRTFQYLDPDPLVAEGYELLPSHQEANEEITDAVEQYQSVASREPAEEFSISGAKEALGEVAKQFRRPEYGVPGVVVLPNGDTYTTDQTETYSGAYDVTGERIEQIGHVQTVGQVAKVAGGVLVLTGKAAPIGLKLIHIGEATHRKAELAEAVAQTKLAIEWGLTQMNWTIDADQIGSATAGVVDWLDATLDDTFTDTDVDIVDVTLNLNEPLVSELAPYVTANRPEEAPGWFPAALQWTAVEDGSVTVGNNGAEPVDVRLTMYDQYGGGENVSNEGTMYPPEAEPPLTLAPGEVRTVEIEYSSDFNGLLNVHTMVTHVWIDGVIAAQDNTVFQVRPGITIGSAADRDRTPVRTGAFAVTDASKTHDEPLTAAELDDVRPALETIVDDAEVTPENRVVETGFTTGADGAELTLLLSATGTVALQVFDEQGRQVGFDPDADAVRTQIPDAGYVGPEATPQIVALSTEPNTTYTVRATGYRFVSERAARVSVQAIETPEREAILSVAPDQASATVTPGGTEPVELTLSEVGEQVAVENAEVVPGTFTDGSGAELQNVSVTPEDSGFGIDAGAAESVVVAFEAAEDVPVPNAPGDTRFDGDIRVSTANAGSLDVSVSALVLDTDVPDARLVNAERTVEGVSLRGADTDQFEDERPPHVQLADAFELSAAGSGSLTLAVPSPGENQQLYAYTVDNDGWTELETGRAAGLLRVGLDAANAGGHLVVAVGPAPVVGTTTPRDLAGDGLYRDVNGDGQLTIADVQVFFQHRGDDVIQDNAAFYNFDGTEPAEVTIADVQALFQDVVASDPSAAAELGVEDPGSLDAAELIELLEEL